jgi:hypothetical protein
MSISEIAGEEGSTNHGGEHALEDGAQNIEDIAEQPDNDELDRQRIRGASLEVLYDLRREYDNCDESATLLPSCDKFCG